MRRLFGFLFLFCVVPLATAASTLDIYFVDVEGGQATLIVTPSGESMLVDTGWPGHDGRDADRIMAAAKEAGIRQIDYLVVTHYHGDHVGGVPQLAEHIPIVHFVDHGPNSDPRRHLFEPYAKLREKGKHIVVKPGDRIPLEGAIVQVMASDGETLHKEAGQPNPLCRASSPRDDDRSENARSVGFWLRFGQFSFLDLGDLTWNKEIKLACPVNAIGRVDVYLTTHHGSGTSGPPAIVHALRPRVAIMNNGAKKGGSPGAWRIVRNSPGLEGLWQLHHAVAGGKDNNSPEKYIANLEEDCDGHWLKLSARKDGSFRVTNGRNGYEKTYKYRTYRAVGAPD
jgi:beta-lactamase superfamily II metal-dependent hydrolase